MIAFDAATRLRKPEHDDAINALLYLIFGLAGDGIEESKVHYV